VGVRGEEREGAAGVKEIFSMGSVAAERGGGRGGGGDLHTCVRHQLQSVFLRHPGETKLSATLFVVVFSLSQHRTLCMLRLFSFYMLH